MRVFAAITAFFVTAITVIASPVELVERQASSGPLGFNLTSIGVNGPGCPVGTVYYVLNAQKTAVTLVFSNYFVKIGPGIHSQNRKSCMISLGVIIPRCWKFGIATLDYVHISLLLTTDFFLSSSKYDD
ncbi:hypothetical protein FRC14_007639 [Serendipita sp. 396]|nr:hypothetical protein FRC14_007639 [Serendipita sp. 396]KAG8839922.1 hypothetical protein FRC18_000045 [Serendipita sp. 400]KAG9046504.1 hypothetical protein FS842_000860 [Serendipita sp. 407]